MKPRDFKRVPLREQDGMSNEVLTQLGLHAHDVLDLSGTGNPYGPAPELVSALRACELGASPEPTARAAREAIAARFATTADRVVLGNGANELLWTCARVLVRPEDTVLVIDPSYAEMTAAVRHVGARSVKWHAVERTGHRIDLAQIEELMSLEKPGIVSLCAPNSPTGASLPFEEINVLASRFPDTYFIVDQSLLALSDDHADLARLPHGNVLCIRSLGKELGLAGLRVGYLLADASLAAHVEACRPSFSTSMLAQTAAQVGMQLEAFVAHSRTRLQQDRDRLAYVLSKLKLTATPSVAPFLLVRMTHAPEIARDLLARHRICVRECSAFGLPDHLRIAGIAAEDERRVENALRDVMEARRLHKGRET